MGSVFTNKLSQEDIEGIVKLHSSLDLVSLEQHPEWFSIAEPGSCVNHFYSTVDNKVSTYAQIVEKFNKVATIQFGPIFSNTDNLIEAIVEIYKHYLNKGFFQINIQLGIHEGPVSEDIENGIRSHHEFHQYANKYNWSTIKIELAAEIDTIYSNFANRHKASIKKASREGLKVVELTNEQDIHLFADGYIHMYQTRKLAINKDNARESFLNILKFNSDHNAGFYLGVKKDDQLIGGVLIIHEGNSARYYKGYTDSNFRHLPITVLAIYEAIKIAKNNKHQHFDLGGYNHYVNEKDKVYSINLFKRGFSKNFVDYPQLMVFKLNPVGYFLYNILRRIKNYLQN